MATKKKRQGTGTETTVSPTKSDIDSLEVPALSLNLDEKMDVAAALLIFLIQTYVNGSKKSSRRKTLNLCLRMKPLARFVFLPNAGSYSCKQLNELFP